MDRVVERPEYVTDEMLEYLDACRKNGINIGDAQGGLRFHFDVNYDTSSAVALYWIRTFTERQSAGKRPAKPPTKAQQAADALSRDVAAQREFAAFNGLEGEGDGARP